MKHHSLEWIILQLALKSRNSTEGYVTYTVKTKFIKEEKMIDEESELLKYYYDNDLPCAEDFRNGDDFFEAVADDLEDQYTNDSHYEFSHSVYEDEFQFFHHDENGITRFLRLFINYNSDLLDSFVTSIEVDFADTNSLEIVVETLSDVTSFPIWLLNRRNETSFKWNSGFHDITRQVATEHHIDVTNTFQMIHDLTIKKVDLTDAFHEVIEEMSAKRESYLFGNYDYISLDNLTIRKPSRAKHWFIGMCNEANLMDFTKGKIIKNFIKKDSKSKYKKLSVEEDLPF